MRHYELMLILDPELEDRSVDTTVEKLLKVVPADGGTVDNVDVWGRRRFAYEINKKAEGTYVSWISTPSPTRPRSSTASSASTRPCCARRSCVPTRSNPADPSSDPLTPTL